MLKKMCKKMCVAIFIKCGIMFTEREIFHKKKTIVYNSLGHKKEIHLILER